VIKHLSALADAGLLDRQRSGREVRYRVTPAPLSDAVSWIAQVGGQWDDRLQALSRGFETKDREPSA
jgi:DNA-binding transcriptional ArsR family regulator